MLDIKTLESWLWEAACKIRGEIDAPKYKDYILPLIFFKRLSDVFEEEMEQKATEYGGRQNVEIIAEADHSIVWFYLPPEARWTKFMSLTQKLGEHLTDTMREIARENPKLNGVINIVDYNATQAGERLIGEDSLKAVRDVLNKHKIGLADAEPDILGRAYEYLLRKFAEGSGQSAGEFYTPREVAVLMARMLDPKEGEEVYDPCLGSGGLLIKTYLRWMEIYGKDPKIRPLKLYGQEINHTTYAMARMNSFVYKMEAEIAIGNTMTKPAFLNPDGSLRKFDIVIANPMWNQGTFSERTYENDTFDRFRSGYPPKSSADWGWIQHMFSSLNDHGRMAVILDTGSMTRGSSNQGSDKEREIRKSFVENDLIESVLLLPDNLFYNTPSQGLIVFINKEKMRKDQIILINASKLADKGRPKNNLSGKTVEDLATIYHDFTVVDGVSMIISNADAAKYDYNISPSRYIVTDVNQDVLPIEEAWVLLKEAEEERVTADSKLIEIMRNIGLT